MRSEASMYTKLRSSFALQAPTGLGRIMVYKKNVFESEDLNELDQYLQISQLFLWSHLKKIFYVYRTEKIIIAWNPLDKDSRS